MTTYAGIDLGGTNLRGVVVDARGVVLTEERIAVGADRDPASVCARIADCIASMASRLGGSVDGVGVGIAAWLDNESGRVRRAPNLGWVDVDVRGLLGQALTDTLDAAAASRVVTVNDLTAVTYGEWQAGAAAGESDVLCVFVGSGLGAGLVLDGRLYEGASGGAGELGHVTVDDAPDARSCGCGRTGCVEAYVGGRYLELWVRSQAADAELSGTPKFPGAVEVGASLGRGIDALTCSDVEGGFGRGDSDCVALWNHAADSLGKALALAVQLLNPHVVVLGGGVMTAAPSYRRLALEAFERRCPPGLRVGVEVRAPRLGGNAGAVGAALLGRDRPRKG